MNFRFNESKLTEFTNLLRVWQAFVAGFRMLCLGQSGPARLPIDLQRSAVESQPAIIGRGMPQFWVGLRSVRW